MSPAQRKQVLFAADALRMANELGRIDFDADRVRREADRIKSVLFTDTPGQGTRPTRTRP